MGFIRDSGPVDEDREAKLAWTNQETRANHSLMFEWDADVVVKILTAEQMESNRVPQLAVEAAAARAEASHSLVTGSLVTEKLRVKSFLLSFEQRMVWGLI